MQSKINLACGGVFVSGNGWLNFDYSASHPVVQRADLLNSLPLPCNDASLVYSSHFLEHIPVNMVHGFLAECLRILAPGGVLRLVLPDLENLCRAYMAHRESGEHEKADFLVLETIDQCVRRESGGELGAFYQQLRSTSEQQQGMISFVHERTGEALLASGSSAAPAMLNGVGGIIHTPHAACPGSCGAALDASLVASVAPCVSRAERQLGWRRRAASLAVGFSAAAPGTRGCQLYGRATSLSRQLCNSRLPVLSALPRSRWEPEKGCRIDVRRSAQAHLKTAAVVLSQGGRND
jgi:predicted SAM-dependent methyltransferase